MPDLPEVEVLRRDLQSLILGQRIAAVQVSTPGALRKATADELRQRLVGQEVGEVTRQGRLLTLHIGEWRLLFHLRGRADLALQSQLSAHRIEPGERLFLASEEGSRIVYKDDAKVANVAIIGAAEFAHHEWVERAGQEPLQPAFTLGHFKRILDKKKRRVKFALADDSMVAGLGSVYADEMLFLAGVRPSRYLVSLTDEEVRDIYYSIFQVVQKSIRFGGLASGGVVTPDRKSGTFGRFLNVVYRQEKPCRICGTSIRMVYLGGDRTYFCPRCQR